MLNSIAERHDLFTGNVSTIGDRQTGTPLTVSRCVSERNDLVGVVLVEGQRGLGIVVSADLSTPHGQSSDLLTARVEEEQRGKGRAARIDFPVDRPAGERV